MKLSKSQLLIYEALCRSPGWPHSVEEIGLILWPGPGARPKVWRESVKVVMRLLVARSQSLEPRIERVSGLGRGSQARYAAVAAKENATNSARQPPR